MMIFIKEKKTLPNNGCSTTGTNESLTSQWGNIGPLFFAELFSFSHTGGVSSISIDFKSGLL